VINRIAAKIDNLAGSEVAGRTRVIYRSRSGNAQEEQTAAALTDLVAGQIDFCACNVPASTGFIRNGQIQALAVTSSKRLSQLPNIPTVSEASLPGFENVGWFALMAPSNTPKIIRDKIYDAAVKAVKTEAMQKSLEINSLTPVLNTTKELEAQIASESTKWEKVIKARNLTAN
jgi:tripartite-type tricarboxylate transporter receptor subunit TctC